MSGVWGKASVGCGLFREVADAVGVTSPLSSYYQVSAEVVNPSHE